MKKNAFDGKRVKLPRETVYEVMKNRNVGIALADIKESEPHYHNKTTEWYLVAKGSGRATLNGRGIKLGQYDVLEIKPGTVHNAESKTNFEVWVITNPPWKSSDHHLVKKK